MKIYFLAFILSLQVLICLGQTAKTTANSTKWTIGTILYHEPAGTPNYFGGIVFKRQLSYFNIRAGIEYATHLDKTDQARCCDQLSTEGYANEKLLRVGVEKGYTLLKYLRPYAALDFAVIKNYSNLTYIGGFTGTANNHWITNATSYGTVPTLGFELLMTKNISAAVETRIQVLRSAKNYIVDDLNNPEGPIQKEEKISERIFDRIGALTLHVNF